MEIRLNQNGLALFLALAGVFLCASTVQATTYNWTNGNGDNVFTNGSNWDTSGSTVLTSADTAFIDMDGAAAPIFSDGMSQTIQRFYIGQASGTSGELHITGGTLTCSFSASTSRNRIGRSGGTGVLNQSGGTLSMAGLMQIGVSSGSDGTYNLSGGSVIMDGLENSGSGWYESLEIGNGGSGLMSVSGGSMQTKGHVDIQSGGTFQVAGSGAAAIDVGGSGTAVDGKWTQAGGGTLDVRMDTGGVTPIQVRDNGAGLGDGDVVFSAGSLLKVDFVSVTNKATYTVMEWEGSVTNNGLMFHPSVDTGYWSFHVDAENKRLTVSSGSPSAPTFSPFGNAVAQYGPPMLPDEPAVYTNLYYPATANAAGIQGAVNAANAAGGGTVKLAAQTYVLSAPITMKSNVRLLGEGMGATVLLRGAAFTTSDKYFVGATDGAISDVVIEKMTLDRDFTVQEVLDNHEDVLLGIRIYSGTANYNRRIRVTEVEALGFTVGILMSGTEHIIIEDCDLHHNGGTYLHHNLYFRRIGVVRFSGNRLHDSIGGSGLKLAGGTSSVPNESRYFTITDNHIYDNERINLNIQGCENMLISGNILERQTSLTDKMGGLYMVSYNGYECQNTDFINNLVVDNANNGMYVNDCSLFSIAGNACYGNGLDYNLQANNTDFTCDYNGSAPDVDLCRWRFDNFGYLFNEGVGADDEDPDGDRRSNLTEYGTGTDPNVYDAGSAVTAGLTNNVLSISFDRIEDPALIYQVNASIDLMTNTWSTIWSSTGASNSAGTVTVEDTDTGHESRFLEMNLTY